MTYKNIVSSNGWTNPPDQRARLQRFRVTSAGLRLCSLLCLCLSCTLAGAGLGQNRHGLGVEKVRLAVPDFKPATADAQNAALLKTFNDTLWNDLDVSGVVELVSKSFYPLQVPGQPPEVNFSRGTRLRPMRPCWHSAIWESPAES